MLVDTNVLVDIVENDLDWAEWSINQIRVQAQIHRLVINPIIYSELSFAFATIEALDSVILTMQLVLLETPQPALFLAAKAFGQYRQRGGTKTNVLSDFFIGAHAAVSGLPILTRDTKRYETYFPSVKLIHPK